MSSMNVRIYFSCCFFNQRVESGICRTVTYRIPNWNHEGEKWDPINDENVMNDVTSLFLYDLRKH